jgi:hypothetical protein
MTLGCATGLPFPTGVACITMGGDGLGQGGPHARFDRSAGHVNRRVCCGRCRCTHCAACAILDGDHVHVELQQHLRVLLILVHRAWQPSDRRRDNDQQRECEHVMPVELQHATASVPDKLRATFAFAMSSLGGSSA